MKKIFALSTTLCVLLFASSVFAASFNTGTGSATWKVANLEGTPNLPYGVTNGFDYTTGSYSDAYTITQPHTAWSSIDDAQWIGPNNSAAAGYSPGYTAYKTTGFEFTPNKGTDVLKILCSADNAITNLFVGIGDTFIDLIGSDWGSLVIVGLDDAGRYYPNGPEYPGNPDYPRNPGESPYGGNGLFDGHLEITVNWAELMSQNGLDPDGVFDLYFITQNTNPSGSASPSGFIASFASTEAEGSTTPEPATLAIMGLGFLGAGIAARRRNKK